MKTLSNNETPEIIKFPASDASTQMAEVSYPLLKALVKNLQTADTKLMIKNFTNKLDNVRMNSDIGNDVRRDLFYQIISTELDLKNLCDEVNKPEGPKVVGKVKLDLQMEP